MENETVSRVYKFVSLVLMCTGGGTLVPIFINKIPVALSIDAYVVAIIVSFLLHEFLPILREIMKVRWFRCLTSRYFVGPLYLIYIALSALAQHSDVMKAAMIVFYETLRASVVVKFTALAAAAIAPSDFSIPVFGPIICGAISGCGGAFMVR